MEGNSGKRFFCENAAEFKVPDLKNQGKIFVIFKICYLKFTEKFFRNILNPPFGNFYSEFMGKNFAIIRPKWKSFAAEKAIFMVKNDGEFAY